MEALPMNNMSPFAIAERLAEMERLLKEYPEHYTGEKIGEWDGARQAAHFCSSEEEALAFRQYVLNAGWPCLAMVPGKTHGTLRPKVVGTPIANGGPTYNELDELWRQFKNAQIEETMDDAAWNWVTSLNQSEKRGLKIKGGTSKRRTEP